MYRTMVRVTCEVRISEGQIIRVCCRISSEINMRKVGSRYVTYCVNSLSCSSVTFGCELHELTHSSLYVLEEAKDDSDGEEPFEVPDELKVPYGMEVVRALIMRSVQNHIGKKFDHY